MVQPLDHIDRVPEDGIATKFLLNGWHIRTTCAEMLRLAIFDEKRRVYWPRLCSERLKAMLCVAAVDLLNGATRTASNPYSYSVRRNEFSALTTLIDTCVGNEILELQRHEIQVLNSRTSSSGRRRFRRSGASGPQIRKPTRLTILVARLRCRRQQKLGNSRMGILNVTDNSFDADVKESSIPTVVDFWAEWCGPCRQIGPSLAEIAEEMSGRVNIAKVNIDENPNTPALLGVRGIPALFIYKDGEPIASKVGAAPKATLKKWIEESI